MLLVNLFFSHVCLRERSEAFLMSLFEYMCIIVLHNRMSIFKQINARVNKALIS